MTRIVLAGNGITAEILFAHISDDALYEVVALVADDEFIEGEHPSGLPVFPVSQLADAIDPASHHVIMAMGYKSINRHRESLYQRLSAMGFPFETYVHPLAHVSSTARLGDGVVLLPHAVVEPYATVGANTVVWANAVIAHHAQVGAHCWIASGAVIAGQSTIGDRNFLGVNATVVDSVSLGHDCFVGGGALISKDAADGTVHLARSAEQIRFTSQQYSRYYGV